MRLAELPIGHRAVAAAFLAGGVFWLAVAGSGEGSGLVAAPGLVSISVSILLLLRVLKPVVRSLAVAAGVYNLLLFISHALSSYYFFTVGLTAYGGLALVGYSAASLIFLIITLFTFSKADLFLPPPSQPSGGRRRRTR